MPFSVADLLEQLRVEFNELIGRSLYSNVEPIAGFYEDFEASEGHSPERLESLLMPSARLALCGDPGVGKTYMARYLANRAMDRGMKHVFWVDAATPVSLLANLFLLCKDPSLPLKRNSSLFAGDPSELSFPDSVQQLRKKGLLKVIRKFRSLDDWLLVLDNMDDYFGKTSRYDIRDVSEFLPDPGERGRILITTRDNPSDVISQGIQASRIGYLTEEDGARFLLRRTGRDDRDLAAAREISKILDGWILALEAASGFISNIGARYPLVNFKADYKHGREQVLALGPVHRHASAHTTVRMLLNILDENNPRDAFAGELLRVSSFLYSENMSRNLLAAYRGSAHGDMDGAIARATELGLFRSYAKKTGDLCLHRVHAEVLRDLMPPDERKHWAREALQLLEDAAADTDQLPLIHAHVLEAREAGLPVEDYPRLANHVYSTDILSALQSPDNFTLLICGKPEPTYEEMREYLESDANRDELRRRLLIIKQVRPTEDARLILASVFLHVHYWWDSYLENDRLTDPILQVAASVYAEDGPAGISEILSRINRNHPAVRNYKARSEPQTQNRWAATARAIRDLRATLKLESLDLSGAEFYQKYALAITNIYLAEAEWNCGQAAGRLPAESELCESLYKQAEDIFREDAYYLNWTLWEQAAYHLEAAKRCLDLHDEKSGDHFDLAEAFSQRALEKALERAKNDGMTDAEVMGRAYECLANIYWQRSSDLESALGARWAACFAAYAFVLSENDAYSVNFYEEQVERAMDWLEETIRQSPEEAVMACRALPLPWKKRVQGEEAIPESFGKFLAGKSKLDALRRRLFPETPEMHASGQAGRDMTDAAAEIVRKHIQAMPARLKKIPGMRLPPLANDVAAMIKKHARLRRKASVAK